MMATRVDYHPSAAEMRRALSGADKLLRRLEKVIADYLPPDSDLASGDVTDALIYELETAPEVRAVRAALGQPAENTAFIAEFCYQTETGEAPDCTPVPPLH